MSVAAIPEQREWTAEAAFAYCQEVARHYENFPVGSLLLPKDRRPYFHSIYAFARTADDYADEPGLADEERLRLLIDWERELEAAALGRAGHPIFVALAATIQRFELPVQLFRDLLSAFRSDVTIKRYETFQDVLGYCRRSANPVGRLVLRLFGYRSADLDARSDDICTALQLANFWQDLTIDLQKGRIYIPQEDLRRFGYSEDELFSSAYNDRFVAVCRYQVDRTRQLFLRGRSLCDRVEGRLSLELRAVWLGGTRILEKIERDGHDLFRRRPTISSMDKVVLLLKLLAWGRPGGDAGS